MNCKTVGLEFEAFESGDLPQALLEEIKEHLETCEKCRECLDEWRKIAELPLQRDVPPVPEDLAEKILEKIPKVHLVSHPRPWLGVLSKAAAVVILAAGAGLIWKVMQRPADHEKLVAKLLKPVLKDDISEIAPPFVAMVKLSRGAVGLRSEKELRWSLASADTSIEAGETLRAFEATQSCARIQLGGGSLVSINNSTAVKFQAGDSIQVLSGEAHFKVAAGQSLTVGTPLSSIYVKGTEFDVLITPGSEKVVVTGGRVEISALDQQFEVEAGNSCVVTDRKVTLGDAAGWTSWLSKFDDIHARKTLGRLVAKIDGRDVPLSVKSHKVKVTIRDQIAYTLIDEEFQNHTGSRLEGTFYYPLPADSSISRFAMYIGDTLMEGEVVERMRAREVYESIVRRKRDPALLEWMGGNQFKARIFPIEPHSTKRVLIGYTQILPLDEETVRYEYPLKSEKLTKNPLAYLNIDVDVYSTPEISGFESPTHKCRIESAKHSGRSTFEAEHYVPERDFLVSYQVVGEKAELYCVPHWREDEKGYFLAFISPREIEPIESPWEDKPTDVLLMIDTSASMAGDDFAAAKRIADTYLSFLSDEDRINVLLFDVSPKLLFPEFVRNLPEVREAVAGVLNKIEPLGASDLSRAISAAAEAVGDRAQIMFIGDGISTLGERESVRLLDAASEAFAGKDVSVSTLAVGSEYDSAFIEGFPRQFDGIAKVVSSSRPIGEIVSEIINDSFRPMITNLSLEFEGVKVHDVYPRNLPNVFLGGQIIVAGRYDKGGTGKMIITGYAGNDVYTREIEISLPSGGGPNTFVPRLWARRCMDDMLNRIGMGEKSLVQEVIGLSLKYKIISPYTSMLVLETEEDYERFGIDRRFTMEQWKGEGPAGLPAAAPAPMEISSRIAGGKSGQYGMRASYKESVSKSDFNALWGDGHISWESDESAGFKLEVEGLGLDTTDDYFMGYGSYPVLNVAMDSRFVEVDMLLLDIQSPGQPASGKDDWFFRAMPAEKPRSGRGSGGFSLSYGGSAFGPGTRSEEYRSTRLRQTGMIYPIMYISQQPQTEPEVPEADASAKKIIQLFVRGPVDFRLQAATTYYNQAGVVNSKRDYTHVAKGKKFFKEYRTGKISTKHDMCDGKNYYSYYPYLRYAAGRKATKQEIDGAAAALPGMTGYTLEKFLTTYGPPKIISREDGIVVLEARRNETRRNRFTVDTKRKTLLKIEYSYGRGDRTDFNVNSSTVFDRFKLVDGRWVATRVRMYYADGKLSSETVYDTLDIGSIDADDDLFEPPAGVLIAIYPLPSVAEAKGFVLALSLEQAGRSREAAKALRNVIAARPEDPYLVLLEGWLMAAAGERDALLKAAEKAEEMAADRYRLIKNIHSLFQQAGLYTHQLRYMEELFRIAPEGSREKISWVSQLANQYFRSGESEKGYELWQKVLKEFPDSGYAWQQAAQFYRGRQEYADEAERAFLRALELGQNIGQQLANFYQSRGDWEKAIPEWRRSLEKNFYRWNFRNFLRSVANGFGPEKAFEEAERYIAEQKDTEKRKQAMLGYLNFQRNDRWAHDIGGICKRLLEAYPEDINVLRELIQAYVNYNSPCDPTPAIEKLVAVPPKDFQHALRQVQMLSNLASYGFRDRAAVCFEKLHKPEFEMTATQEADYLNNVAGMKQRLDPAEAIEIWEKILTLDLPETDHRIQQARNQIFYQILNQGDFARARKMLTEIAVKNPNDGNLRNMLQRITNTLRQQKKLDELIDLFSDLRKVMPDMDSFYGLQIASIMAEQGKVRESYDGFWGIVNAADSAMEGEEPAGNEPYIFHRASRMLIRITAKERELKEKFDALVAARAGDEKPDGDRRWSALLVDLYRARGRFEDLTEALETLSESEKDNDTWRRQLAAVYAATRRYEEAVSIYEKFLEKDPRNTAVLMELYRLASAMKQTKKADTYWQAWLEALPEDENYLNQMANSFADRNDHLKSVAVYEKLLSFASYPQNYVNSLVQEYQKLDRKLDAAMAYLKATRPALQRRDRAYSYLSKIWPLITEEGTFNKFADALQKEIEQSKEQVRKVRLMSLMADLLAKRDDKKNCAVWGRKAVAEAVSLNENTFDTALTALRNSESGESIVALLRGAVRDAEGAAPMWLRIRLARELFEGDREGEGEREFRAVIEASSAFTRARRAAELAELIARDDPERALSVLEELTSGVRGRAGAVVLSRKADIMAKSKTFTPSQVVEAYSEAAGIGPMNERTNVLEALIQYASEKKLHDAVIEGYKMLCRHDRQHNVDNYMRRLGDYLRKHKLDDRAEEAFRECVRASHLRRRWSYAWRQFGQFSADKGDSAKAVRIWTEGLAKLTPGRARYNQRNDLLYRIFRAVRHGRNKDKIDRELVIKLVLDEMDLFLDDPRRARQSWPSYYWDIVREFNLTEKVVAKIKTVSRGKKMLGDAYKAIGDAYYSHMNQPESALKYYKMALQSRLLSNREHVLGQMASIYEKKKDWRKALDLVEEIFEQGQSHQNYHWHMQKGFYLANLDRTEDALKSYEEARRFAGWNRYSYSNHHQIGMSAFKAGLYDFAIKEFMISLRMCAVSRDGGGRDEHHVSESFRQIARCYKAQKNLDKAIDCLLIGLTRVSERRRRNLTQDLISIYRDSGNMDELVAKYERDAAESKIEKPSLRMIFGDMYSEKKNYEEALRQYVAALEVAPNRGDVRKKVIDILRRMPERSDELIEQYRDWLKYDPKNVSLYREMGDLLKRSGREADVMRAYTTMLEAMPTEAESHREMAAIYTGMNRHTDAVNMWKKVVRYRPEEPRSYYGLADSYRRGKQIALAADVYRQMIKRSWESRFGDVRGVARNRLRKTEAEM